MVYYPILMVRPLKMECKKCGEIEPYNHDIYVDGLWDCECLTYKTKKVKLINGKKPLDFALENVQKLLDKEKTIC